MSNNEFVMAMYDIRGIQNYVYRTARIRDAIGASWIIERIIDDALKEAADILHLQNRAQLQWKESDKALPFHAPWDPAYYKDMYVLYVGGGNGVVLYSSRKLCHEANRIMSKYVLEKTYSLQLAAADVNITDSYSADYKKLQEEMDKVKSTMPSSKPVGVMPVTEAELDTGYPAARIFKSADDAGKLMSEHVSTETYLKRDVSVKAQERKEKNLEFEARLLDNYTPDKGKDSTIAVVHMDGNNMGKRIGSILSGKNTYEEAANAMRNLSFHIDYSYSHVFEDMKKKFTGRNTFGGNNKYFVRRIITAGDDITYICTGKIALATMQYFAENITQCTMTGENDPKSIHDYGFSICGGAALIHSHFPFSIGYEVAEALCDSAKDKAKLPENMDGDRVGNYIDFQICKNVQASNLDAMRMSEYVSKTGENLLARPYYVKTAADGNLAKDDSAVDSFAFFRKGMKAILQLQDKAKKQKRPSFLKDIRNTYSLGRTDMKMLKSFLASRGRKMPDGTLNMYENNTAKWYDILEMMDDYVDIDELLEKGGER